MILLKTIAVAAVAASSVFAEGILPLQPGNTWMYREPFTGQEFTITAGVPAITNGRIYYSLRGYVDKPVLVRHDNNRLMYLDEDTGGEAVLTSFDASDKTWVNAPFRQCAGTTQALEKPGAHDGPAGTFDRVLEVAYRTTCADAGVTGEQYAENLGMLRRTITTIAGPRQFDLIYARVGKMAIETRQNGRFMVSVDDSPDGNSLRVTMRLQTDPGRPLTLRFNTAQEYDVALRDEAGNETYRWSSGMAFAQALHDLQVSSEWKTTVSIPSPKGGAGAAYSLEAWLTTGVNSPKFAASVPLAVMRAARSAARH